jgi:misacylated tRNA(Ala) deacylase
VAVPGRPVPVGAPPGLAATELFSVDAYVAEFEASVEDVDTDAHRVALRRTAFYPGGGGQPHDLGTLRWGDGAAQVVRVGRESGRIWHWLDEPSALPDPGADVQGLLDWERRHLTMRTHTALHILCGVMWADHGVAVTGGNMDPGKGRLDFPLPSMSAEFGRQVEARINEEIEAAHEILVEFVGREVADEDHALIRTAANLIPREIDPLRVIDIVGLDKQADGGTHVLSTVEVGRVRVTGTESKGKGNKRVRLEVLDSPERSAPDRDRAGHQVVQPALVAVEDQRRHHQADQQGAHQSRDQAQRPAVDAHDSQPGQQLAEGASGQCGQHTGLDEEHQHRRPGLPPT